LNDYFTPLPREIWKAGDDLIEVRAPQTVYGPKVCVWDWTRIWSGCKCGGVQEQLLRRNVKRFRGGLVFKVHGHLYHSSLGLRVIKRKQEEQGFRLCFGQDPPRNSLISTERNGLPNLQVGRGFPTCRDRCWEDPLGSQSVLGPTPCAHDPVVRRRCCMNPKRLWQGFSLSRQGLVTCCFSLASPAQRLELFQYALVVLGVPGCRLVNSLCTTKRVTVCSRYNSLIRKSPPPRGTIRP